MFAPRRTAPARRGAPLLTGLAVGAVLIGAAAVAAPEDGVEPALHAALGAPLPVATPTTPPAPTRAARYTVPAPVTTTSAPTTTATTTPPTETPPTTTVAPEPRPEPDPPAEPEPRVRTAGGPADSVVTATNDERGDAGCGDLDVDDRLTAAAQGHAEDMAENDYFSHTSLDGREFDDRIRAEGHPAPGGENIAAGQETAQEVVAAWMDSPGHRRNILDCSFTSIGVGYDPDGDLWVQNFGR